MAQSIIYAKTKYILHPTIMKNSKYHLTKVTFVTTAIMAAVSLLVGLPTAFALASTPSSIAILSLVTDANGPQIQMRGESELSLTQAQNITETGTLSETTPAIDESTIEDNLPSEEASEATLEEDILIDAPPILEGTIIANRTGAVVTFFIEGGLQRLEPLRSTGIVLPRDSSALNLFNCDADDSEQSDENCFWDPYLVQADGFYEILNGAEEGLPLKLILAAAGAPDQGQIWVQNRTTATTTIFFGEEAYELPPTALSEFEVPDDTTGQFYLPSCLSLDQDVVCEWLPQEVPVGVYYALNETRSSIGLPNSELAFVKLTPILGEQEALTEATRADEAPPSETTDESTGTNNDVSVVPSIDVPCQLNVPTLNIRSGPGLEYLVISQAFATQDGSASILAIGQDPTGLWLATDERIIAGGWIVSDPNLLTCDGNIGTLPIAEVADGRLAPVQEIVEAPADSVDDGAVASEGEDTTTAEGETEETVEQPPKGQVLLLIENSFEADIRFTLDEEIDLKPGDKISLVVNAGRIQFSASSAWKGGMAGNAEFTAEPDETRRMYLYFIPDPDNSSRWLMRYQ